MQITPESLIHLSQGFNAAFKGGFEAVETTYQQIAMTILSTSNAENYGWLKELSGMREWVGQRVAHNLESVAAKIVNKKWEHTIAVRRDDIEDDNLGMYRIALQQQGEIVARHPDDLVWGLLKDGFTTRGFDGQPFFDADHPGHDNTGSEVSWSNVQAGSEAPWYLMDLSRINFKPVVYQVRQQPKFVQKTAETDDHVFLHDTYLYGAHARSAVAFGFHQLAFGSQAALTADNFNAARIALQTQYRPDGSALAIRPTHLIVGPSNEAAARKLLNAELINGGETNIWRGAAQLIVSPHLA